jgi:hypothetical protein
VTAAQVFDGLALDANVWRVTGDALRNLVA